MSLHNFLEWVRRVRAARPKSTGPNDNVKLAMKGHFRLELRGPDGQLKEVREADNLVVDDGLDWLREYAFDSVTPTTKTRMSHIAIGTGTTAEAAGDSTLQSEVERLAFDAGTGYVAGGTGVCTVAATFPAAGGYEPAAITEAGVFNDAAAGQMWNRVVFAAVNKTSADTLKVTVTVTFTAVTD
jgi:hypothetical protein